MEFCPKPSPECNLTALSSAGQSWRKIRTEDGITLYRVNDDADATQRVHIIGNKTLVDIGDKLPEKHDALKADGFCYVNVASILSVDTSNVKLAKTAKKFKDILSVIYYGAPSDVAGRGINTCQFASAVCRMLCLNTAGNGSITSVQLSRIARTRLSRWMPVKFWSMFETDLARFKRKAQRENKRLACRPNGTTDERCAELIRIIRQNPDSDFYDYSAVPDALNAADELPNYFVTFSRKETTGNLTHCRQARQRGYNIAAVCCPDVKELALRHHPDVFTDFDKHDLRIPSADGVNKIGLLTPKGRMRKELKPGPGRRMTYRGLSQLLADFNVI